MASKTSCEHNKMKVTRTLDMDECDFCKGIKYVHYKCFHCKKDICGKCVDKEAVTYRHAVHKRGRGDGIYCHRCNDCLADNELHVAYLRVSYLERSWDLQRKEFEELAKRAAENIDDLRKGYVLHDEQEQ